MNRFRILVIAISAALLAFAPAITAVHAVCGPGNASDSWTPRTGVTFSITASACPGINPTHKITSSRTDSTLVPQSGNYTFEDDDNILPNTGTRVLQTTTSGVGTMPSVTANFGPFYSPTTPNCGYTDFYIVVEDTTTGQLHTLIAGAYGQTQGTCPV